MKFRAPEYLLSWGGHIVGHRTQHSDTTGILPKRSLPNPQSLWAGTPGCKFSLRQSQAAPAGGSALN